MKKLFKAFKEKIKYTNPNVYQDINTIVRIVEMITEIWFYIF